MSNTGWQVVVRQFALACIVIILSISGCRAQAEQSAAPLPTPLSQPTAATNLDSAWQVSRAFLDAWQQGDFETMHSLITFRNRELTPLDEFHARYIDAQGRMTLESIEYTPKNLTGEGRVLVFQYDMTFHSRILGSFTDAKRLLHLVIDPQAGGWRVAWSPAAIFAEMGQGARLIFEAQVPSRANIYDRDGQVLADQSGRVVRVLVNNGRIPDRDACFEVLSETIGKPLDEVRELFDVRSGADWIVDAGIMESSVYVRTNDRVKSSCNADFRQQPTRRNARGTLMPHIIGNVGYPDAEQVRALEAIGFNAETIIGKSGVEAGMNDTLAGRPGGRLSLVAADGSRLRILNEVRSQIPESIWLTIDADLQENIARLLREAYRSSAWAENSKGAAVIIMDVNNGEILAMVSHPTYDGNIFNPFPDIDRDDARDALEALLEDEAQPQLNRPAQGVYVTGSVMKVLGSAAVLESGVYDESTRYVCTGTWRYGRDLRTDWLLGGHGSLDVQGGITNSCNPFFYQVGFRLNAADPWLLPSYALKLGLGQSTGVNVIQEAAGNIPTPDNVEQTTGLPWSYAHAVNLSIGQGEVQVSPLQMVRMYAAIANGGYLLRPHLVRERGILDQRTRVGERDIMRDIEIDAANLAVIQQGMCDVVNTYSGTASHQFLGSPLLEVGVCGKTGTAQVPGEDDPPHSWFIAYAPAKEPQIAIVTLVENAGEGSAVAAPLTREILEVYFFGSS